MRQFIKKAVLFVALNAAIGVSMGAPQTYNFSADALIDVSPAPAGLVGLFDSSSIVSGTFAFDSGADFVGTAGPFSIYGPFNPLASFNPSFTSLAGSVDGRGFSDVQGITLLANDSFDDPATLMNDVDFLSLNADPGFGSSATPRNIVGFTIGDYTLLNVRMFWVEGQQTPELIDDFLSPSVVPGDPPPLPGTLPSFHGVLALDFIETATGDSAGAVLFNNLSVAAAVPEPETYAMLLAGLGLMGIVARRRKKLIN